MGRLERVGRGLGASAFAVLLAALSHVVAGGNTPSLLALVVTVAVGLPVSILLSGKRLSLVRLSALVVASQALFHFSFAYIGAPAATSLVGAQPHTHSLVAHVTSSAGSPSIAGGDALMWASHLAAAAVTIALLARGERALFALILLIRLAFAALVSGAYVVRTTSWKLPHLSLSIVAQPTALRVVSASPRRGPPVFSA